LDKLEIIETRRRISTLKNQVELFARLEGETQKLGTHEEYIEPLKTIIAFLQWVFPRKVNFYKNGKLIKKVKVGFFQNASDLISKEDVKGLFESE